MSVTTIPQTNYTIQNNQIHDPDGKPVSKEAFLNKVDSKSIILSGNALNVIGETFGTEYANKLAQTKGGSQETLFQLNDKLNKDGTMSGDMMLNILQLIHKTRQTQKEAMRTLADKTVEVQKTQIGNQADKMKEAAMTQMWFGIATAGMQAISAGISIKGGAKVAGASSQQAANATNLQYQGYSGMGQAAGSLVGAIGQGVVGNMNAEVKRMEGEVLELGHRADEAKKMRDNVIETEKKARETIQAVLQARDQAMSKAVNMS